MSLWQTSDNCFFPKGFFDMPTIALATLYKMDSKGKIREWSIRTDITNTGVPYYEQIHGLRGGKLQETKTLIRKGKNVGRANETTPMEQCNLEAQSLWNKQRDRKGYTEAIPTEKPKMPMLAKSYQKDGKKIKWPAAAQPKLDGIRCMAILEKGTVTLKSRTGKEFKAVDHIKQAIIDSLTIAVPTQGPPLILDGELYNHEYREDFQRLVSAIKRDDPSTESQYIQYHVYDYFSDKDFSDRSSFLEVLLKPNDSIVVVPTYSVGNFDEFKAFYGGCIDEGFEGAMLRNLKGPYEENRRSPNLQKFKEFYDAEFRIVDAYENKGKQAGQCTFSCVTDAGAEFGVKPKGSDAQRQQYWKDWQNGTIKAGDILTVRYFEMTNSDPPVPRFPVGIAIRNYE